MSERTSQGSRGSAQASTEKEYRLAVVGGGGVGKSAITIRFINNDFLTEYDPTIEDTYRKAVEIDEMCFLEILDTAGQEEFKPMRDHFIHNGEGFLIVYSCDNRASFQEVQDFHEHIQRLKNYDNSVPILILGNKCDLPSDEKVVSVEEGRKLASNLGCTFFETSAKTSTNVTEAFFTLVRQIKKKREGVRPSSGGGGCCTIL
eukprot:gnl/Trimastix_PCT/434.p2 GENE.gnl/Trimastix_PCT/434~~gnl/Trimastix_PCT/434.p2  ORF type:complete len:203 (-),score=25.26 gnl/Trimastix_PCT/434:49-657(-)